MNTYIAHVAVKYDFASEKLDDLGGFFRLFVDKIPREYNATLKMSRFTFCNIVMDAENPAECKKVINQAWEDYYKGPQIILCTPEGTEKEITLSDNENNTKEINAISEILVSKYTEGEVASDLTRSIYNNLYGADEYLSLITELNEAIPILKEKEALDVVRKTNYVFAVDHGCGYTTLLSSFGDYIHKMRFYPDEEYDSRLKYYKFELGPNDENGKNEFDTVISILSDDLEQKVYNIIGLDVSYYLEKSKQDELRNFIRRLGFYQDKYVFVFRIPFMEKKAMDETMGLLSDIMPVRLVQIPPLHECVLMENYWNILTERNLEPDVKTFDLILDKIRQEKTDGRFYGFKTLEKIANEVIIKKMQSVISQESEGLEADKSYIKPEDLEGFVDVSAFEIKGYASLDEMIGMEKITEKIREIIAQVKLSMADEKLDRPCIHMRFTGAPGTGKTTVARILGQIMKDEGILRKGAFLEYTGRDLCAEYVGQTSVKTSSICRDSYGSVLFIDEAYSLYDSEHNTNDFGKEAIATLVSEMENHRDDMLVVMAGYTDEMDTLMKANPGLRSRMPYIIDFPNYSREQLFDIFMLMVRKHFKYTEDLEAEAKRYFTALSDEMLSSKEFANARFVRNLYERTWSKGALRASLSGQRTIELKKDDFIAASQEKEFSEKLDIKKKIGF